MHGCARWHLRVRWQWCAGLYRNQHGPTESDALSHAMKEMEQGGEVTGHRDQLAEVLGRVQFGREDGSNGVCSWVGTSGKISETDLALAWCTVEYVLIL